MPVDEEGPGRLEQNNDQGKRVANTVKRALGQWSCSRAGGVDEAAVESINLSDDPAASDRWCEIDAQVLVEATSRALGRAVEIAEVLPFAEERTFFGLNSTCHVIEVTTTGGESARMFVKRALWDRPEATHYEALRGLSYLSEFYATTKDESGREILLLEYVPTLLDLGNPTHVDALLHTFARLNTMHLPSDYDRDEHVRKFVNETEQWQGSIRKIVDYFVASAGWPREQAARDYDRLVERIEKIRELLGSMTFWPDHNDPHAGNALWRENSEDAILVDLHGFGYKPRFYGACNIIAACGRHPRCSLPMRSMSERYIELINERLSSPVSLEAFRIESLVSLNVHRFRHLHWSVEKRYRAQESEFFLRRRESNRVSELLALDL